ncbi:MAG: hypothetical protein OEZ15_05975 [Gammaproteobacteria bacterium]|nr:hypothetical protein [Gammaproteobacteria bacterium]
MRKLLPVLIFTVLLLPNYVYALGLGDIHVDSTLNQKLDARINLVSAVPEDAEVMIIKLASQEEFLKAGIDRPHLLNSLKFKAVNENGQLFIKVTSSSPIREPSLNFLLDIDWPDGHMLRQYTVLLNPPVVSRTSE